MSAGQMLKWAKAKKEEKQMSTKDAYDEMLKVIKNYAVWRFLSL